MVRVAGKGGAPSVKQTIMKKKKKTGEESDFRRVGFHH